MKTDKGKIQHPGWRLIAAIFASIGAIIISAFTILLGEFSDEDKKKSMHYGQDKDGTIIGHGDRETKVIGGSN